MWRLSVPGDTKAAVRAMRQVRLSNSASVRALVGVGVCLAASSVRAQDVAPSVVRMPAAERPAGVTLEHVEVEVVIDAGGAVRVTECAHEEGVCEVVGRALEESEFRSATRDGESIAARIRVRVVFEEVAEPTPEPVPPEAAPVEPEPPEPSEPAIPDLGVTADVDFLRHGARRLTLEEARDMPGALGDPFRAVLALPGVVPMLDGLPYFYLRGAAPSGTVFYYDSIPLPALYHLGAGPAVVHPRMVGDIQVQNGIAPARYGRHTGGVVLADGAAPPAEGAVGEAELRLFDLSGYARVVVDDTDVAVAGRFGYPGLLLSAVIPGLELQYWDVQGRMRVRLGGGQRFETIVLASYDTLAISGSGSPDEPRNTTRLTLTFQRVEARYVLERGDDEVGFALRFGHDESSLQNSDGFGVSGLGLRLFTFGPRVWFTHREESLRLRVGGDMYGASGEFLERADGPDPVFVALSNSRQRASYAIYAQVEWQALRELEVIGGVRVDLFTTPANFEAAIDPRLRVIYRPDPAYSLHIAAGIARQPAVFAIPLPGISELPLTFGLQTAIQSEVGVSARGRLDDVEVEADLRGYLHRYENMMFSDLLANVGAACTEQRLCRVTGAGSGRVNGIAWGAELGVRARLGHHFSARFAYTLGWLESDGLGEISYTPTHDIRHVMNVVLGYDSHSGFSAGLRGFLRSGTVQGFNYVSGEDLSLGRYQQRLPWFGRLDASVAYAWDAGWSRLRLSLEWVNVTFAAGGEPQSLECESNSEPPSAPCPVSRNQAIFIPNLGLRGTFE